MGHYYTSDDERLTQSTLNRRIEKAKRIKKEQILDVYGYFFCEDCQRSDCDRYDMSHDLSIQDCKNQRRTELCYDPDNITLRCRDCHRKYDGL